MSKRAPRILWASAYSLLDTSSGAAIAVRSMLSQLQQRGYEICIVTATIFDDSRGVARFAEHTDEIFSKVGQTVVIQDGALDHRVFVTQSTKRMEITEKENIAWFKPAIDITQDVLKVMNNQNP